MPDSGPPRNTERIETALRHVEMGFRVMSAWSTTPNGTCKCPKGADCGSPGKHPIPQNGFLAASDDIAVVTTMLSAASEPNYGLVWPDGSRVLVILDVDGADWKQRIDGLIAEHGPLPATKTTRTPSGGLHLFYWWPEGALIPHTGVLHGFVVRFPMKGYVIGPGSAINGKVYTEVGPSDIAELPLTWADSPVTGQPLFTVGGEGYELPDHVATGTRHEEIIRYVASRWNRGMSKDEIAASIGVLIDRFDEPITPQRLANEIDVAWDSAIKRWGSPASNGGNPPLSSEPATSGEQIVIDPLAIESRIERPDPLILDDVLPTGLALLLDHYRQLTDAPWSSLALTSCVVMSALAGTAPTLGWRGSHRAALFGVLVGHSGYGRKGATMREVERAFMQVDPLLRDIQTGGMASGEVLVDILNESKQNSLGTVLLWEHEIANVLILAAREGNIMSGNLRKAWDGDAVESRSRKTGKSYAVGYNMAFMGGVTPSELEKRLTANDIANGWANRFLWFHSEKRPEKYDSTAIGLMSLDRIDYLRECIEFARKLGSVSVLIKPQYTMTLSDAAFDRMETLAESLDVIPVGAIGALRQRMPLHVIRLAMVAALFEQSNVVDVDHVRFGERMAGYAIDSMRSVFGLRLDDAVAMLVLRVLAQVPDGWMNTSNLRKATGGKDHSRLMTAMDVLLREGLVVREDRASGPSGGRPAVGYRLAVGQKGV